LRALELHEKAPSTPGALANAGVPFALYSDGVTNSHDLKRALKKALDAGLSEDALVRAFTLSPAEIYGLSDRLGSIEKGKIANLVVTKGNLFGDKTEVKFIFVDGKKFTPEPEPEGPGGAVPGAGPAEEDYR
jgi:imidazolonepropionase-like amidohydrolase